MGKRFSTSEQPAQVSFDKWQNSPGAFSIVSSDGSTKVATYTSAQISAAK